MTILIGVLCSDGVVIGSDSASTFVASNQLHTIEQETRKIELIRGSIILAGTGSVGLNQRFAFIVDKHSDNNVFKSKKSIEIGTSLSHYAVQDFIYTGAPKSSYGAMLAFHCQDGLQLCEFDGKDFQPEFKRKDKVCFVSMGSGQHIADPFLGFLKKVFWKDRMPHLNEGIFVVAWTLRHAIELNTGGINGPAQIATLSMEDGKPKAHLITPEQLAEHEDLVEAAEKHLSMYRDIMSAPSPATLPEMDSKM